jgi:hypothetical protein
MWITNMPPTSSTGLFLTNESRKKALELEAEASRSFEHLSDYVWKTPRLIEAEESLERLKIETYFPITGDNEKDRLHMRMRALRNALEMPKLQYSFPTFIANSNLFLSASTFEYYCLNLCKLTETQSKMYVKDIPGNGASRFLNYLKKNGIIAERSPFYRQVMAALKLRNCLIHANGVINMMNKDSKEIRRIVASHEYDSRFKFDKSPKPWPPETPVVRILATPVGDQLMVDNEYSWIASVYFHRCFENLVMQALRNSDGD